MIDVFEQMDHIIDSCYMLPNFSINHIEFLNDFVHFLQKSRH